MPVSLYHGDMPFTHPFCEACPKETSHANIERQGDCVQIKLGKMWFPLCTKHAEELYQSMREWFKPGGQVPISKR